MLQLATITQVAPTAAKQGPDKQESGMQAKQTWVSTFLIVRSDHLQPKAESSEEGAQFCL